jgi:hypothetical protein
VLVSVVSIAAISLGVFLGRVDAGGFVDLARWHHPVVDVTLALAGCRTTAVAECVGASPVAVRVALLGRQAFVAHILQCHPNLTALAGTVRRRGRAPDQILFRHVDLLVA